MSARTELMHEGDGIDRERTHTQLGSLEPDGMTIEHTIIRNKEVRR